MLHFWNDRESRMVNIHLVGEQIILQPSLIDCLAEEAWSRPMVATVPRSLDPASLGRMAISMLSFSTQINTEREEEEPVECPPADVDESEWPEFMDDFWAPPPPLSEESLALRQAEERRLRWPGVLRERLAGVSTRIDYIRNVLSCSLLQSGRHWQITPFAVTDPGHPECTGKCLEEGALLLERTATEADLGRAIRIALERARNPWLPFLELFRTAQVKGSTPPLEHPLNLEPEWIPSNLSFIHGETMERKKFWELIRRTRPTPYIYGQHRDNLAGELLDLDPKEIASFEKHYLDLADELYDVRVVEVMWVLSGGGPGDEGWALFTSWLIMQGRKNFERVLDAPERLPVIFPPGTDIYGDGIGIGGLARDAYEESTGRDNFDDYYEAIYGDYQLPEAPRGARIDPRTEPEAVLEKRLRAKYPDLWEYVGHYD